jgi:osmotically inducible lipoprotein OsmE
MNKNALLTFCAVLTLGGCAGHNPVDRVTYRDQPLVEKGMTKEQVLQLGGPPSSEMQRTVHAGTCNNYVLNHEGKEQTYYVSFDASGVVDSKGFITCAEREKQEQKLDF